MSVPTTMQLQDGVEIPRLGLGVFRAGDSGRTRSAVLAALDAGYRHVDTAKVYRNEREVGDAIASSGVPRESLFVTTKLWRDDFGVDAALRAFDESLERLGLDYVDLYLMHWPAEQERLATWRAMESLVASGRCRSIGVSNFTPRHFETLLSSCDIAPAVNQIELHPFLQQRSTVEFCRRHGIALEAWAPLTKAQRLDHEVVVRVAAALGRSPAQVLIRWSLEQGFITLPKSTDPARIAENARVFDFELEPAHRAALDALDEGYRTAPGWDPTHAP